MAAETSSTDRLVQALHAARGLDYALGFLAALVCLRHEPEWAAAHAWLLESNAWDHDIVAALARAAPVERVELRGTRVAPAG